MCNWNYELVKNDSFFPWTVREWFKYEFKTTLVTEWQNNYWTLLARKMICQCSRWSIDLVKIDKPWYFAQPPPIVNYFSSHRIGSCWNNSIYCPIHTSVRIFMCMDWDIHHVFHGVPYITRQCGASLQADWTLWPIPWPLFHFGSPLPSSSTMSLPINDEGNVDPSMYKFWYFRLQHKFDKIWITIDIKL